MFVSNENENKQLFDEDFHQKILVNGGVCTYFGNVFLPVDGNKLPTIKHKLRKILVDFGLVQTCMEINQSLGSITIWYQDPKAKELKELFVPLRRDNKAKESQAIELVIDLEGSLVVPPKTSRGIKTYSGLTKFLYQEFVSESMSYSLADDNPYNQMREIIKQGNLAACVPLESILRGELG